MSRFHLIGRKLNFGSRKWNNPTLQHFATNSPISQNDIDAAENFLLTVIVVIVNSFLDNEFSDES
jgi:hypothetical protein